MLQALRQDVPVGVWGCCVLKTEAGDAGCLAGGCQPDRMETCGPEEPDELCGFQIYVAFRSQIPRIRVSWSR